MHTRRRRRDWMRIVRTCCAALFVMLFAASISTLRSIESKPKLNIASLAIQEVDDAVQRQHTVRQTAVGLHTSKVSSAHNTVKNHDTSTRADTQTSTSTATSTTLTATTTTPTTTTTTTTDTEADAVTQTAVAIDIDASSFELTGANIPFVAKYLNDSRLANYPLYVFNMSDPNKASAVRFVPTNTSGSLEAKLLARQLGTGDFDSLSEYFGGEVQQKALQANVRVSVAMIDDRVRVPRVVASVAQKRAYAALHNFSFSFHAAEVYRVRGDECLTYDAMVRRAVDNNWEGKSVQLSKGMQTRNVHVSELAAAVFDDAAVKPFASTDSGEFDFYFVLTWLWIVHRETKRAYQYNRLHQPWCILHGPMAKLGALNDELARAESGAFVWLVDADVIIKRMELSLRGYAYRLREQGKSMSIATWQCGDGTNDGSFVLRNDEWGRALARRWLDQRQVFHMFFYGDQGLYWIISGGDASIRKHVHNAPPRAINARHTEPRGCARGKSNDAFRRVYSHLTDFNVHLTSLASQIGWNTSSAAQEWCDFIEYSGAPCTCDAAAENDTDWCDISDINSRLPLYIANLSNRNEYINVLPTQSAEMAADVDVASNATKQQLLLAVANEVHRLSILLIGSDDNAIQNAIEILQPFKAAFEQVTTTKVTFYNSSRAYEFADGLEPGESDYFNPKFDRTESGYKAQYELFKNQEGGAVFPATAAWSAVAATRATLTALHRDWISVHKKNDNNEVLREETDLHWLLVVHLNRTSANEVEDIFNNRLLRGLNYAEDDTLVHTVYFARDYPWDERNCDFPWLVRSSEWSRQLMTRVADGHLLRAQRARIKKESYKVDEEEFPRLLLSEKINATETLALFRRRDAIVKRHVVPSRHMG